MLASPRPASPSSQSFSSSDGVFAIRSDLGSKNAEVRARAARAFKQYVEQEARDRSKEGFQKVLTSLLARVEEYASSTNVYAKLGCILVIDELIAFAVVESETMVIRFASQLSIIVKEQAMLHAGAEIEVLDAATRALGHLARAGPPSLTYDHLEHEVNRAIGWMDPERHEMRRHAALFVITELAQNAPALLYSHVGRFFDSVWRVLCDVKITIRVRAALALRSVLRLVGMRDANASKKNYEAMYMVARQVFPPAGADWTTARGIKKSALTATKRAQAGSRDSDTSFDARAAATDPFHPSHRTTAATSASSPPPLSGLAAAAPTRLLPPLGRSYEDQVYDSSNVTLLHASLLTFYELLDPLMSVNFMEQHFFEILNDCVMREEIKNHKDALVVHHVIALLPRLAQFCPNGMLSVYLKTCVRYLLETIARGERKKDAGAQDRSVAFRALGQLAEIPRVSTWFTEHVPAIVQAVKSGVAPTSSKVVFCDEALECLEIVVRKQGIPQALIKFVSEMIPDLFGGGLTEQLVNLLAALMEKEPSVKKDIRGALLFEITRVLGGADGEKIAVASKAWFPTSRMPSKQSALLLQAAAKNLEQRLGLGKNSTDPSLVLALQAHDGAAAHPSSAAVIEATTPPKPAVALIRRASAPAADGFYAELEAYRQRLAIRTLGAFDFAGVTFLPIVMAAVLQFLESNNVGVRLEAVVACCRLLSSAQGAHRHRQQMGGKRGFDDTEPMVSTTLATPAAESGTRPEHVIERLVVMALTDSDADIRCRVVTELDGRFRHIMLENPENLRSLFVLVNDQHFAVRAAAIKALGHLTELAPSYVMPTLRTVLVRLLTELDFGGDLQHREESATLLGLLVQSLDPPLARPHVESMLKGLLPKLRDPNQGVAAAMMATLGEVAVVAGDALLPHVNQIFAVVIDALEDKSTQSNLKREWALHTLSKVVRSTIMSVWPYFQHRRLLDLILSLMMNPTSPWAVRRQAMIALGTLGALDPMLHKMARLSSGEEGFSALGQTPEELAKFSAERFSLSLVFVVFGGTSQDDEDEFDTDFELDDKVDKEADAFASLFTLKGEKTMWLLDQSGAAAVRGDVEGDGGDLDFVYPSSSMAAGDVPRLHAAAAAAQKSPRESGLSRKALAMMRGDGAMLPVALPPPPPPPQQQQQPGAQSLSGGVQPVVVGGPVAAGTAAAAASASAAGAMAVTKLRRDFRDRRSSLVTVAAVVAPLQGGAGAGGANPQNPVIGRMLGAQHSRRLSNLRPTEGSQTPASPGGPAGLTADDGVLFKQAKDKTERPMDRVQRLRALASGARTTEKDAGVFGLDPSTVLPSMVAKGFYTSTVALSALVRVLANPTAVAHRKMAVGAIMKIFKVLKTARSGPFLQNVVPHLLAIATTQLASKGTAEQRSWPLSEIGRLVGIVKGQFKSYLPRLFELTRPYFDDGDVLPHILELTHAVAKGLEARSLQLYVPNLLPEMLGILRYERETTEVHWPNTPAVLKTIATLGSNLGDYLYLVMPMLMKLIDNSITASGPVPIKIRVASVHTLLALVQRCDVADYASHIVHPLVRALRDCYREKNEAPMPPAKKEAREVEGHGLFLALVDVFKALVFRLEEEYAVYVPTVEAALEWSLREAPRTVMAADDVHSVEVYRTLVQRVLRGQALPKPDWFDAELEDQGSAAVAAEHDEDKVEGGGGGVAEDRNGLDADALVKIKNAWDASARTTEDDWTEWMRRLSLALLAVSPSPALESCGPLAQVYEPLAHDLFNAAFAAVWTVFGTPPARNGGSAGMTAIKGAEYRELLVQALMQALQSQHLPKDILQNLLNLAEFMEHDDKPLPLDLRVLGEKALKIQAYAKALHYKEIEFKTEPENTIEALISINKNLDQINAAQGVVDYVKKKAANDIELQPSWFAQLGNWQEALKVYNAKAARLAEQGMSHVQAGLTAEDMEVNVGRMSCAKALGEWNFLTELADDKRAEIRELKRNTRLAGNAAARASGGGGGAAAAADVAVVDDEFALLTDLTPGGFALTSPLASDVVGERPVRMLNRLTSTGSKQTVTASPGINRALSQIDVAGSGTNLDQQRSQLPRRVVSQAAIENRRGSLGGGDDVAAKDQARFGINLDDYDEKEGGVRLYIQNIARLGAYGCWMLGEWGGMASYLGGTSRQTYEGAFLRAVLHAHLRQLDDAEAHIEEAYRVLGDAAVSLVSESYSRAYARIVHVQELVELQELVEYKRLEKDGRTAEAKHALARLRSLWRQRAQGVQQNVDVLLPILAIRSMVVNPHDDIDSWLNFAKVARQQGRHLLSLKALMNVGVTQASLKGGGRMSVGGSEDAGLGLPGPLFPHLVTAAEPVHPRVAYAFAKHLWAIGQSDDAVARLKRLTEDLMDSLAGAELGDGPWELVPESARPAGGLPYVIEPAVSRRTSAKPIGPSKLRTTSATTGSVGGGDNMMDIDEMVALPTEQRRRLAVQCNCTLGEWRMHLSHDDGRRVPDAVMARRTLAKDHGAMGRAQSFYLSQSPNQKSQLDETMHEVLGYYERAIKLDPASYKAWRLWALTNFEAVELEDKSATRMGVTSSPSAVSARIVCAITGLFRSIDLGSKERSVLQDVLRVLALWFRDGTPDDQVLSAIQQGFHQVSIDTWLDVIPQLIARVNAPTDLVCVLLRNIGKEHPQELLYPLTVASSSDQHQQRSLAASKIMSEMKERRPELVEEALLVSRELIRVAVLWHEMWHEGLEDASRLYFINHDPDQMIAVLAPLHDKVDAGPETLSEVGFCHAFGRDLREASEWLAAYAESRDPSHLNQAWDLYYKVFRVVSKQLDAKSLELRHVSPQLLHARKLQLAIPGTYSAGAEVIRIEGFLPTLRVIKSKQRPRVVTMAGSDGLDHMFLLKGHEDLRLDERVMQLMDLVNNLLASDPDTNKAEVEIHNYAVVPLSSRAGVMEWVPSCDTIFELVKEFRESRNIPVNVEHRLVLEQSADFDQLTPIQKVEVFQRAVHETSGQDLAKVLWLKSANSETWLDRRTTFTRSLASMSIVGYILGLGDRHPSNLMVERASGRVLHIDFGDCFEVALHRDKFPENVPFRLTRMLVNAMEASGVEGNFRLTCVNVMRVLRFNRDSVMTMLSAFVHDPLITWALFKQRAGPSQGTAESASSSAAAHVTPEKAPAHRAAPAEDKSFIGSYADGGQSAAVSRAGARVGVSKPMSATDAQTNSTAVKVTGRVRQKLRGTDFGNEVPLAVEAQVDKLIREVGLNVRRALTCCGGCRQCPWNIWRSCILVRPHVLLQCLANALGFFFQGWAPFW